MASRLMALSYTCVNWQVKFYFRTVKIFLDLFVEIFQRLIFIHYYTYENILTPKIPKLW